MARKGWEREGAETMRGEKRRKVEKQSMCGVCMYTHTLLYQLVTTENESRLATHSECFITGINLSGR